VLSLPIPLRVLLAAQPQLLAPLLQVIIATFLIKQVKLKRRQAGTGAVTLIQRFDSAARPAHPRLAARPGAARRFIPDNLRPEKPLANASHRRCSV
jgi:hypothetical protein